MIHILNRRADTHPDYCEDAFYHTQRDEWVIAAVFDGCSGGNRSHYASWLYSYCLRSILDSRWNEIYQGMNATDISISLGLTRLCCFVVMKAQAMKDALGLTNAETESTMLVAMYHPAKRYLITKFLGDGVISVDGALTRVDSGPTNAPNYPTHYNWQEESTERWIEIMDSYPEFAFTKVNRFSLCTDGIDHIKGIDEDVIPYLLDDTTLYKSEAMLTRKINILRSKGATLNDDLTIIRYTNEIIQ